MKYKKYDEVEVSEPGLITRGIIIDIIKVRHDCYRVLTKGDVVIPCSEEQLTLIKAYEETPVIVLLVVEMNRHIEWLHSNRKPATAAEVEQRRDELLQHAMHPRIEAAIS